MSEPVDLVEQELSLIKEIEKLADEQYTLKTVRRFNNSSVRAWRLNIMRRVQSVQEHVTGTFSEDEYKHINSEIDGLNDEIQAFGAIEFDNAVKLSGSSREIRKKLVVLENELQEKINVDPLIELKTKFTTRIRDAQGFLREEKKAKREVERENKAIEEDNKSVETKFALFRAEARTYVENVNKELGWVTDDGQFAYFDEEREEIECFSADDMAEGCSNWFVNQEDTNAALRELPNELQDDLSDRILDEPELAYDKASLYQYFRSYCESKLAKFEMPVVPAEDFEELKKVPEIQPRKIRVDDIVVPHLNPSTILQGNKIPDEIIEELESYRSGKYELTIQHAERINELAEKYNLLNIEIVRNDEKQSVRAINSKIRELMGVQNAFGSERNSRTGQAKIKNFIGATQEFLAHTRNQEKIFGEYYKSFQNAAQDLEDWINRSWWQFGGQPENHHNAGHGDSSAVTKSEGSKSDYNGPTL